MHHPDTPSAVVRPEIAALTPYTVQDARGLIKLDAMENPFPFPEELRAGLAAALAKASLARYPDPAASDLKAALRRAFDIPAAFDILLGNGSDEIIQMVALAVARPGATLLSLEPGFAMFRLIATVCGMRYCGVPLMPSFAIDLDATLATIAREQPAVIFIAYPNNPTGNLFDRAAIEAILAAAPGLVVIDEAYFAFASQSLLPDLSRHANAVLMRTVSKLGLAGARLGFLVGEAPWLTAFERVRLPYNINALTQAACTFALEHAAAFRRQADEIVALRRALAADLHTCLAPFPDAAVFPSEANFLLFRVPDAAAVFARLRQGGVLVKYTGSAHPLLADTLRVTVGTADENRAFLRTLQSALHHDIR